MDFIIKDMFETWEGVFMLQYIVLLCQSTQTTYQN